jgi:DNA polymerase-3 subunit beta
MTTVQSITAPAKEWIAALTRLSPAMAGKKPLAILTAIRIAPESGIISGYNYETSATTQVAEPDGQGAPFLASYSWLLDAIRSFTGRDKSAPVTVAQDGDKISVAACGYEVHVEAMPEADYPAIPNVDTEASAVFSAAELRAAFRRVSVAASCDDTLPILTALQVHLKDGVAEILATDRYRLASDHVMAAGDYDGEATFLLSRKTIKSLDRFLVGESVRIGVEDNRAVIQTDTATYTTVTVDGDYPKIRALFPESVTSSFEFDRHVLLESAKVAERLNERWAPCLLSLTNSGADVTFNYGIFGPSKAPTAAGSVVAGQKDDVVLALNPLYLVEALQQIPGDQVRISYTSLPKPFLFSQAGIEATAEDAPRHLIMPVRMPS